MLLRTLGAGSSQFEHLQPVACTLILTKEYISCVCLCVGGSGVSVCSVCICTHSCAAYVEARGGHYVSASLALRLSF